MYLEATYLPTDPSFHPPPFGRDPTYRTPKSVEDQAAFIFFSHLSGS